MVKYRFKHVDVAESEQKPATWAFAQRTIRGTEFRYAVTDKNHRSRNRWVFLVRVPDYAYGRIEVRPVEIPNDSAFVGLERRALTFMRATRGNYTRFRYCPLAIATPQSNGARDVVHRSQKKQLPSWLRRLGWRLKQKATVRRTRGTDAESLVVLVRLDDHKAMIRVFLATKAWILKRGVVLE